jgi:hypothetical protein
VPTIGLQYEALWSMRRGKRTAKLPGMASCRR